MTDDDDRVQCVRCGLFKACRCFAPLAAGISHKRDPLEVGTTLANLPQRCPAFVARKTGEKT